MTPSVLGVQFFELCHVIRASNFVESYPRWMRLGVHAWCLLLALPLFRETLTGKDL
ncbi:MAG: hypothetical protein O2797_09075 [Bacteroidetes bacterium]|nr:hypothetical protein [Bacteroidota bacterium]